MKYLFILSILLLSFTSLSSQKKFDNTLNCVTNTEAAYKTIAKTLLREGIPIKEKDADLGYIQSEYIENMTNVFGSTQISYVFSIEEDHILAYIMTKVDVSDAIAYNENKNNSKRMGYIPRKKSHSYKAFDQLTDIMSPLGCNQWLWTLE